MSRTIEKPSRLYAHGRIRDLEIGQSARFPIRDYWRVNAARHRFQVASGQHLALHRLPGGEHFLVIRIA